MQIESAYSKNEIDFTKAAVTGDKKILISSPLDANTKPSALLDLVILRDEAEIKLGQKIRLDKLPAGDILTHKQFIELGGE
jgi:hypothetical protein